jgi:DNA-directed RNA polymerase specialized sigma24 family protein
MGTITANRTMLRRFIEENTETLLGTLRTYVVRASLADRRGATLAAAELLNEVTVEALEHAERFRPSGQPRAWLLGIAANLIKRKQVGRATRDRREPLVREKRGPIRTSAGPMCTSPIACRMTSGWN